MCRSDSLSADPSLDFSAHWWRDAFTLWKAAPSRSVTSSSSVQQPSSSVDGERKTQATDGDVMKRGGDVITRDGDVTAETRNVGEFRILAYDATGTGAAGAAKAAPIIVSCDF